MNIGIVTTWLERGASYVSRQYYEVLSKFHNVYIYARGGEKYEMNNPDSLLNKIKHLIKVRKSHPIFALGEYQFLAKDQKELLVILRKHKSAEILCVLNLTGNRQSLTLDLQGRKGKMLIDLIQEKPSIMITERTSFSLDPYEFLWLQIIDSDN